MKVFISWSGEASKRVADLLRKYLPCMIQELKPFMSQHDLSSGARWSEQLSKELEQSNFGIICLTPSNLQSAWILFEAGALTKHVEGRACCLLLRGLGPADVSGPLSQFQNRLFSREGFQKLLFDINNLLDTPLDRVNLQLIIDKWWPDLEAEVTVALADSELSENKEHKREPSDILEELLLRVRNIQRSVESNTKSEPALGFSGLSFREVMDRAFGRLSKAQLSLLREFITPTGVTHAVSLNEIEARHSKADIDALVQSGFIRRTDGNLAFPHALIAEYVADNFV